MRGSRRFFAILPFALVVGVACGGGSEFTAASATSPGGSAGTNGGGTDAEGTGGSSAAGTAGKSGAMTTAGASGAGGGGSNGTTGGSSGSSGDAGMSGGISGAGMGGSAAGGATCPPMPQAVDDIPPWKMRAPGVSSVEFNMKEMNGHPTAFFTNTTSNLTVGAALDQGGVITSLGFANGSPANFVDGNTPGHGLSAYVEDTAACWSILEAGDGCNHLASATAAQKSDMLTGPTLHIETTPLVCTPATCSSNPCSGGANVASDVTFETDVRFVGDRVIEIMTSLQSMQTSHPVGVQAVPLLFVPPDPSPSMFDAHGKNVPVTTMQSNGSSTGLATTAYAWVATMTGVPGVAIHADEVKADFLATERSDLTSFSFGPAEKAGLPKGVTVRFLAYVAVGEESEVDTAFHDVLQKRPPFGTVELPKPNSTFTPGQPIPVTGWVLDEDPSGMEIVVTLDGAPVNVVPIHSDRSDVCAQYPGHDCSTSGITFTVPTDLSPCAHVVEVKARDADGNESRLGTRVLTPG